MKYLNILIIILSVNMVLIQPLKADDEINAYVVQIVNEHLSGDKYSLYLRDGTKPVFRFNIPANNFGGCTVNHKLKSSSYLDLHIRTPKSLNISLDTQVRKPYFAKEFTIPLDLNGRLNMVTRTGVRILGGCSNYTKDNWYYSLALDPELKLTVLLLLDPHLVQTIHGPALKLTPEVKLGVHLKDFDENDIVVDAHNQDWGWLWSVLDFSNRIIKSSLTNPSNFVDEFKKNRISGGISLTGLVEFGGIFTTADLLDAAGLFNDLQQDVSDINTDFANQMMELQNDLNQDIRISLRKYRLWAAEAGESNPNTIYIPINAEINNIPEPTPLKAKLNHREAIGCRNLQWTQWFSYSAIDATSYKVKRKNGGGSWYTAYSGTRKMYELALSSYSSASLKFQGCNANGCGEESDIVTATGRKCTSNNYLF